MGRYDNLQMKGDRVTEYNAGASEIRFADRTWSYVGSSRIRVSLLRLVGAADTAALYAERRDAESPSVLYIPAAAGRYDLYRKQRDACHDSEVDGF